MGENSTAMAGGSPPRTSPRPPVLLHGAISAPTKTMFMPPVAAHTTRDGKRRPPGRCVLRACHGVGRAAPVRMASASGPAGGRGLAVTPWRRNADGADLSAMPKPACEVASWDVARAVMSNEVVEHVAAGGVKGSGHCVLAWLQVIAYFQIQPQD